MHAVLAQVLYAMQPLDLPHSALHVVPEREWSGTQWVKLQSDIGHFPSIFGTCPTKNQYVLPICPNAQRVMNAHVRATRNTRPRRCAESA